MANLKVNMSKTKNPMPEQDPVVRAGNFDEVALGYDADTAMKEAARCLDCNAEFHSNAEILRCPVGRHELVDVTDEAEPVLEAITEVSAAACQLSAVSIMTVKQVNATTCISFRKT